MTASEQKSVAKAFADYWKDKGDEKQETARFWIELLGNVLGVADPTKFIEFEKPVIVEKNQKYIDGYIPSTKVLIEQKGAHVKLGRSAVQSNGEKLTPYGQAFRYNNYLPYEEKAKWIIVSNFKEILIYNMNTPNGEPEQILLKDLPKEYYRLQFLVNTGDEHIKKEMEVSLQAGELVGKLYNAILKQYKNPDSPESLKSLNMLCVRLVFCLYAEDAGIFGRHGMFHDYLRQFDTKNIRKALIELFKILDTTEDKRDPYDETMLSEFPYVNGGLFKDEDIEIPNFSDEILDLLLRKASEDFDWSLISPTIFGAVFESTLNPETRRSGGMHYTSIENIHKVIDPLFLDELRAEFATIKEAKQANVRKNKLEEFQKKLASLKFLDPACGSGNFLTETYISLRRLENDIIYELNQGQMMFGDGEFSPIQVSIGQFYGIEINDFAVTVAKTALWIAESQMMKATEEIVQMSLDFLPLKSYANIVEGNALRVDWESVVPKDELNYIMGNPPFVANTGRVSNEQSHSQKMMDKDQSDDRLSLFGKDGGLLDYVSCWIKKSSIYMKDTTIRAAFVSTDSITQGQQVEPLWKDLLDNGVIINFAHKSFKWKNDSNEKSATVYVVIIGFSYVKTQCLLYDNGNCKNTKQINAYLLDAPNIIVSKRTKPLCKVPSMMSGGKPVEGGHLIFTDEEKQEFLKLEPSAEKYFKRFTSGETYINGKMQWCLWLADISPIDISDMPHIKKHISLVREFRLSSSKEATRKAAETPHKFMEIKQPTDDYLIIPLTTSRNRQYIPIGYLSKDIIANNGASFVPNASIYHFGVLTSSLHMGWMRTVCGYFGPSYRYSNNIVYNNFPWCDPTPEQKARIEESAQSIISARNKYFAEAQEKEKKLSLANLYGEDLMLYTDLIKAHQANDLAVKAAYGFDKKMTESECVAELMRMYREMMEEK